MVGEQEFISNFGKRLSVARKQKGLTQEQLAELVEVQFLCFLFAYLGVLKL
jgi:transcriptional regulator with XRE-family HTH domain